MKEGVYTYRTPFFTRPRDGCHDDDSVLRVDGTLLDYTAPFADLFAETLPTDASEETTDAYFERVLSGITQVEENPYRRAFESVRQEYDLGTRRRSRKHTSRRKPLRRGFVPRYDSSWNVSPLGARPGDSRTVTGACNDGSLRNTGLPTW